MNSDLVVISWWSNCLGLACLYNLVAYTRDRHTYVVQVGKPEEQQERFRMLVPPGVEELCYPPGRGTEDWRVRETVACELLADHEGLWFIDHDLFVQEDCSDWLQDMDCRFSQTEVCLCHASSHDGPSITNPAFWVSPRRFPVGMPSFARLPRQEGPTSHSPDAADASPVQIMPQQDTLVAASEFLRERGLVCEFPLTEEERAGDGPHRFPDCEHLGGLYTFAGPVPPESSRDWVARCVQRFSAFYAACPAVLVGAEDPALLERLEEFRQAMLSSA